MSDEILQAALSDTRQATQKTPAIADLYEHRRVVVCIGTGGVGKTTVAASIALSAARANRRVAVLTIDPSKRLAQALGLDLHVPEVQSVDIKTLGASGQGSLSAQMLDVQHTFDTLVRARSSSKEEAERILANRIYKNFSQSLVGSHEYAAVEVLTDLYLDKRYDLIVVDTPPSQNAIDFFGAPARILAFLSGQGMLGALPGASFARRIGQRLFDFGGSLVQKTVGRVAGASTLEEVLAFLRSLGTMYASFEERARGIDKLLRSKQTGFCLVGGPGAMQLLALEHYISELKHHGLHPWGIVLNRLHPAPYGFDQQIETQSGAFVESLVQSGCEKHVITELKEAASLEQMLAARDYEALCYLRKTSMKRPVLALEELSEQLSPDAQLVRLVEQLEAATLDG